MSSPNSNNDAKYFDINAINDDTDNSDVSAYGEKNQNKEESGEFLKQKIEKLEKELEGQKLENNELADSRNLAVAERNSLEEQYAKVVKQKDEAVSYRKLWEEQCAEVVQQKDKLGKQHRELIKAHLNLKKDFDELDKTSLNLNRRIFDLEDKLDKSKKEIADKEGELLAKDLKHKDEMAELKEENDKLKRENDKLKEENDKLKEENDKLKRENEALALLKNKSEGEQNRENDKDKLERENKILAFVLAISLLTLGISSYILFPAIPVKILSSLLVSVGSYLFTNALFSLIYSCKEGLSRENNYSRISNVYKHQDMNLNYVQDLNNQTLNSQIFDQSQMLNNIGYHNMDYNYAGTQQSLYPVFQDDINKEVDLPTEKEINKGKIQSSPANIENVNVNKDGEVKPVATSFFPSANKESLDSYNGTDKMPIMKSCLSLRFMNLN